MAFFIPHAGCPHQCSFCDQKSITGESRRVEPGEVAAVLEDARQALRGKQKASEIAFFGGSFTGIPIEEQNELLSAAKEFLDAKKIQGIRLSTRPDYINKKILDNLKAFGVTTIELGVQSMDNGVLFKSGRGHTEEDVVSAVKLIRQYDFTLGLQMMTGLPGDTDEKSIRTAEKIIALKPDIVRIYPTLTIKDTCLEEMYNRGEYKPQTVEEAVRLCSVLLEMFEENGIKVIRLGLQSTDEICENGSVVAGPVHSAFGELVESSIYYGIISKNLKECGRADVFVNPREVSKAVGNRKINIQKFKERGIDIKIHGDESLGKREVRCVCY